MERVRGKRETIMCDIKNNAKGLKGSLEIWRRYDIIRIV